MLKPLTDDLGNTWSAGKVLPVDIAREGAEGGFFCAHGGSCLPRTVNGQKAVILLNCKAGPALGGGDHRLVADPDLAGAATARAIHARQTVESRLSAMGFSNASAGSLADDYVNHPQSVPGQLVRRALEGSADAITKLKRQYP